MTITYNQDITRRNTFRMKVSAACVVEYDSVDELAELYSGMTSTLPKPFLHIGAGSNLLFTRDFPGTLLHSCIRYMEVVETHHHHEKPAAAGEDSDEVFVEAGAGVTLDDLCGWAAEKGLWGIENLSHIPGEVGAAAVQNVGAYGVEAKDVISHVNCFDTVLRRMVSFSADDCGYGYRDSLFKRDRKGRYIVTSVVFRMSTSPNPVLGYGHLKSAVEAAAGFVCRPVEGLPENPGEECVTPGLIRSVIINIRREKLPEPSELGSAGSFFKNPVVPKSAYDKVVSIAELALGEGCIVPYFDAGSGFVKIPAAWLIDQCGWKGFREGNVGVYERQPLVIVNATGEASPDEILALEAKIVKSVKDRFDIDLHPEVEHV